MTTEFSLEDLTSVVQAWCEEHQVYPANGQAAEEISERTIRYYRTLGLLDPPIGNYAKTFSDKHRLQLIAIRLYQAQGLPLRKIRDELYGKSLEDLCALEKQVSNGGRKKFSVSPTIQFLSPAPSESWSVVPLAGEFLLVSRQNRTLPRAIIEKINHLLSSSQTETGTKNKVSSN